MVLMKLEHIDIDEAVHCPSPQPTPYCLAFISSQRTNSPRKDTIFSLLAI